MNCDSTAPPVATKYAVTLLGDSVTRSISADEIRAYLIRKGFRLAGRYTGRPRAGADLYTLVPETEYKLGSAVMQVSDFPSGGVEFKIVTERIAKALGRAPAEVLRELAGEPVTLEDARSELRAALAAAAPGSSPSDDWIHETSLRRIAQSALDRADAARSVAARAERRDPWIRVIHAAEDLASIAIAELRRTRPAPAGPTS